MGEVRYLRWLIVATVLATAQMAAVPTYAQFFWDQQYQSKRSRSQSDGFFGNFFGPYNSRSREEEHTRPQHQQQRPPIESSRAPAPHRTESKIAPTTSIVVIGDDMADWLAYGLEEVFSDSPEIGIVRKNKLSSGLLRYDGKSDLDWWHAARDILAQQKADYVIMMLGLSDRQDIRQKDLAKEAEKIADDKRAKDELEKKGEQKPIVPNNTDEDAATIQLNKKVGGVVDFRSDEWAKIYSRRIDETIAALKSKGVPVIWVGLPSIRGPRSTADAAYLNELYRTRAERAGITYVDVWDGFVDEDGKYSNYGPDYEGQMRRLRSGDGVFFTKHGAVKIARYVEHELRRYMSNQTPVALPSAPIETSPFGIKPAERPLAGPVVPLTGRSKESDDELAGDNDSLRLDIRGAALTNGDAAAPRGRADDFVWPYPALTQSSSIAPSPAETNFASPAARGALALAPGNIKRDERKKTGAKTQATTKKTNKPE